MILSMTGFGHAVIDTEVGQISVSVRSVNSRYLDIKIRGLNLDPTVERDIRQLISSLLKDKGYNVSEAANYDQALIEIE